MAKDSLRTRRIAGNLEINRNHLAHAVQHRIGTLEDSAVDRIVTHRHHDFRIRRGFVSLDQSIFHIARDRARHHQHVGVTGRSDKMHAEPLDVIKRIA